LGSGTTAIAALSLNRQVIGFEIKPEYCEIATQRIQNHY
jgi:adenine-specific DNA-methyltransferase